MCLVDLAVSYFLISFKKLVSFDVLLEWHNKVYIIMATSHDLGLSPAALLWLYQSKRA